MRIAKYMLLKIYSLVKKTCIDSLESTGEDGRTINSEHIRLKGIPASCIKYYAEQNNMTVLDAYNELFGNKAIKFDLANGGNEFACRNKITQYQMYQISLEMQIHQRWK